MRSWIKGKPAVKWCPEQICVYWWSCVDTMEYNGKSKCVNTINYKQKCCKAGNTSNLERQIK